MQDSKQDAILGVCEKSMTCGCDDDASRSAYSRLVLEEDPGWAEADKRACLR